MRLWIKQTDGAVDQHRIDRMVDLSEIRRPKGHAQPELGQGVMKAILAGWREWLDLVGATGLQPEVHIMMGGKRAQMRFIFGEQGLKNAQHQRQPVFAQRDLDLGQSIQQAQRLHQPTQRHQQRRDPGRKHLALLHVGYIARATLMKSNQHTALAGYMSH